MLGAIAGGLISTAGQLYTNYENNRRSKRENARQYDLARNSIKYRVQDAKNAGIHPLYALGGQTMGSTVTMPNNQNPMADLGQSITNYSGSRPKGQDAAERMATNAQIQGLNLDNELKQQQLKHNKLKFATELGTLARNPPNAIKSFGKKAEFNPNFSDAEQAETRYGDIAQELFGISNIIADVYHNYQNWSKNRVPYKPKKQRAYRNYNKR